MSVQEGPDPTISDRSRRTWTVVVAVLLVAAAALGFAAGRAWDKGAAELGGWHQALATTGTSEITIQLDGWTYGAAGSVDEWIDNAGSLHESSWPDCLSGPPGQTVPVRFQARAITVDGVTWRSIVAVDCRTTVG